jgi:putative lipoic acid-binding regulatory protein
LLYSVAKEIQTHYNVVAGIPSKIMNDISSYMKFPCSFPIKVMGLNTDAFEQAARGIFEKRLGTEQVAYARRLSNSGKYLSITATFTATSREQLDALYQELNSHELVVMTL